MINSKAVFIYFLKDPRKFQPRYVGSSVRPKERLKEHKRESKLKNNNPKNDWIRKLTREGICPEMIILEETEESYREEKEKYWTFLFKGKGYDILNYAEPGGKPPTFYGKDHPMYGRKLSEFGINRR